MLHQSKTVSSTFCVFPWTHLATLTNGSVIPCCIASDDGSMSLHNAGFDVHWNSSTMTDIRKRMLDGKKVNACNRCYTEESNGIDSHRTQSNFHYLEMNGSFDSLLAATDADGTIKIGIQSLDLRLGNNCNLKCVMCRPAESSKWLVHAKKMADLVNDRELKADLSWKSNIKKDDFEWCKKPSFWEAMEKLLPDMREVIIGGGEPFLSEEQNRFLHRCVESGHSKHLKIRYHTNGTILPEQVVSLFPHFKEIQMMVSLDGAGDLNNYMRFPADWQAISKNLRRLDETPPNVTVFLLCSVHAMSLFHLPDLVRWKLEQGFKKVAVNPHYGSPFNTGLVHDPSHLNIRILPKELKAHIGEKFEKMYEEMKLSFGDSEEAFNNNVARFKSLLDYMNAEDWSALQPRFREFINAMDTSRGTSFRKVFPELSEWMNI